MAPAFLKNLRRRSRTSIATEQQSSADDSSEGGAQSQGTGPSSGSATPASIGQQSDPALNLQVKDSAYSIANGSPPNSAPVRPPITPIPNTNRHSVSGMSGLGAPSIYGRQNLPVSQYAPRIHNAQDGIFVSPTMRKSPDAT